MNTENLTPEERADKICCDLTDECVAWVGGG